VTGDRAFPDPLDATATADERDVHDLETAVIDRIYKGSMIDGDPFTGVTPPEHSWQPFRPLSPRAIRRRVPEWRNPSIRFVSSIDGLTDHTGRTSSL
jgi:hypothetical protein